MAEPTCRKCDRPRGLSGNRYWCLACCIGHGLTEYRQWCRANGLTDFWAGVHERQPQQTATGAD